MHDYYLVTLLESLIFLGFLMVLAFDLMGVIWREKKNCTIITELNSLNPCKIRHYEVITMGVIWRGNIFCVLGTKNTPTILYNC